ncbi:hypothetical protein [Nocardia sp. NRRL S-836]|uniref:hypothetical protein n=1 Tax=Nocardia sp. NRRL S-836 TaxID=1519492 RepID=UPI0006AD9FB5|nr:hypothetical protein [Nocardia sp. NRRL S-836]KOV77447.1 hypothetical protein ADL03_41705 [Nocardia sp. NRRL S-836]
MTDTATSTHAGLMNGLRSTLVISGGMFERDAVGAIAAALLRQPHATGKPGNVEYEATVRAIAQVAFTALFEHCSGHRGTIDLPLTGTPYAAMLLLAGSLVAENEQMREAARRNAQFNLAHEQQLLDRIESLRGIAEGYNSLHGSKPDASAREVAHMAWVDHRHRHNIGGQHTPRFCKACHVSSSEAHRLFAAVSDETHGQHDGAVLEPQLLTGHVSPETAYVVKSRDQARVKPRADDHVMRYWIETREKGARAGMQRLMHQSNYRCEPGEWNPPQHDPYASLVIMYLDEDGLFGSWQFSTHVMTPVSSRAFRRSALFAQLGEAQRDKFEQLCVTARHEYAERWDRFERDSQALADYIRATGEEPQAVENDRWVSSDGTVAIRHTFAEHLVRARELLQRRSAPEASLLPPRTQTRNPGRGVSEMAWQQEQVEVVER